ncbi:DUF3106 domain-containing protein [Xylophilus rhododendri]|uniref:DUF3106 domain-containing protein n=1 Tax=Xylophilus rhododendri TaxID=2697032 RepID=A0A857J206_9BURK|nr:DUF3106 domain-containing protein [Xylophilus rhododendri]QHI96905.1 DUF3106 domain-containing protein [Xylophilus rhododendri]
MPSLVRNSSAARRATLRRVAAAVMLASAAGAWAQAHVAPKSPSPAGTLPGSNPATTRPTWAELTPGQREALAPLAQHWSSLTENHRRKWIAISRNFDKWDPAEQSRMHGRMSAWAGLSTIERDQARLNFAEARKLDRDEKKARWEEYQALSEEQRDKLAATTQPKRPGAAVAPRPSKGPALVKLVPSGGDPAKLPRVGVPASEVDHNTLLPQHLLVP